MTQLTRRDFLKLSGGLAATAAALAACKPLGAPTDSPPPTVAPPTLSPTSVPIPTTIPISEQTITRALRRLMFAPKPEDYARAKQIGLEKFVDEMLAQP
ncbi:MAG: twin-arginine translocation signal domain-containing protein, partial [Chloroflexi bacterium]|nr:twin-arginine translocation signal domain-containing protein [Chloroflexota bacterium]